MRRRDLLLMTCALGAAAPARAEGEALRRRLADALDAEAAAGFTGAVHVSLGGETVLETVRGAGLSVDSRFWIASLSKSFVSAAVMICQDQGRLRLDQTLGELASATPADKRGITVRQLLAHASGLPQSYAAEMAPDAEAAMAAVLGIDRAAEPGERFIYSNANYELAAALVERASGLPYRAFVERAILAPAGMERTSQEIGHAPREVAPAPEPPPSRLAQMRWGPQGFVSTVRDLHRFRRSLTGGRLLSDGAVSDLFAPVVRIAEGRAALGWFLGATSGGEPYRFNRGNEDFGANGLIYHYPRTDAEIIVLTHVGDKPGGPSWSRAVHGALERILFSA